MQQGLIHLYWGEGKGKTTAAMGLALRALGNGKRVVIVQFLKGGDSGEIPLLRSLGATVYRGKAGQKFVHQMDEAEKLQTRAMQTENLRQALREPADLLILDEACGCRTILLFIHSPTTSGESMTSSRVNILPTRLTGCQRSPRTTRWLFMHCLISAVTSM